MVLGWGSVQRRAGWSIELVSPLVIGAYIMQDGGGYFGRMPAGRRGLLHKPGACRPIDRDRHDFLIGFNIDGDARHARRFRRFRPEALCGLALFWG